MVPRTMDLCLSGLQSHSVRWSHKLLELCKNFFPGDKIPLSGPFSFSELEISQEIPIWGWGWGGVGYCFNNPNNWQTSVSLEYLHLQLPPAALLHLDLSFE